MKVVWDVQLFFHPCVRSITNTVFFCFFLNFFYWKLKQRLYPYTEYRRTSREMADVIIIKDSAVFFIYLYVSIITALHLKKKKEKKRQPQSTMNMTGTQYHVYTNDL